MKKLLLGAAAVALLTGFAGKASAECDGIYGAIRGGVVRHDVKGLENIDQDRLMVSGALGYRYEYFRTELEYVWRDYIQKKTGVALKQSLRTYSYMWNAYYDILPYNWWTPYVGAGLGWSKVRYRESNFFGPTESWSMYKFTWSIGGGLSLKVTNRLNIDAGYRYYDMGNPSGSDLSAQEVYAGLRYVF